MLKLLHNPNLHALIASTNINELIGFGSCWLSPLKCRPFVSVCKRVCLLFTLLKITHLGGLLLLWKTCLISMMEWSSRRIWSSQQNQVAQRLSKMRTNCMVGTIRRSYSNRSKHVIIIPLYKSLVRPILEYCMQAWCPYHQQDIDYLEGVQRRVNKMISGWYAVWTERLRETNLLTLEMRGLRGDLIEVSKINHNLVGLDMHAIFSPFVQNLTSEDIHLP